MNQAIITTEQAIVNARQKIIDGVGLALIGLNELNNLKAYTGIETDVQALVNVHFKLRGQEPLSYVQVTEDK